MARFSVSPRTSAVTRHIGKIITQGRTVLRCVTLALATIAVTTIHAFAGSFQVTPIRVDIQPGQRAATITIENLGDQPSSIQARAFSWTQSDDQDHLTPTQQIVLSPPIFTIPPGQTQTVRLLLRSPVQEPDHPWRLLFDEIPAPGKPGQIVMAMRLSVPLLIEPSSAQKPALSWKAQRESGGTFALLVTNNGKMPVRLTRVTMELQSGRSVTLHPVAENPYVLPGVERRWEPLQQAAGRLTNGAVVHISAITQIGPMEQTVRLP